MKTIISKNKRRGVRRYSGNSLPLFFLYGERETTHFEYCLELLTAREFSSSIWFELQPLGVGLDLDIHLIVEAFRSETRL
jgi:hypothetical protein